MYSTVLFASDLTEQSSIIGEKAKSLANMHGAALHCVHVVEPVGAYGGGLYYLGDLNEEIKNQATTGLNNMAMRLGVDSDKVHLIQGHTKDEILELATSIKADLIVLGTHGAKGFAALLGSTASSVLNGAKCDVLTVPLTD